VIGGGYQIRPSYDPVTDTGANVAVHTSKRVGDHYWEVGAIRDAGADAEVVAYAFCEADFFGDVRRETATVSADGAGAHLAVARCPGLRRVVSGGFEARPLGTPGSSMTTGLFPWISVNGPTPRRRGWAARVHNYIGSIPGATIKAYAYCKFQ
jgi:hypothetical protein